MTQIHSTASPLQHPDQPTTGGHAMKHTASRITFSKPMIFPLLERQKWQTRRLAFKKGKRNPLCELQAGDMMWVREQLMAKGICNNKRTETVYYTQYFADGTETVTPDGNAILWEWKTVVLPPIYMPKWASRMTLEIIDVRQERLQDITEEDAIAEGIKRDGDKWVCDTDKGMVIEDNPIDAFAKLWDSINGNQWEYIHPDKPEFGKRLIPIAWADNPEIVVLSFKTHLCNIKQCMEVS